MAIITRIKPAEEGLKLLDHLIGAPYRGTLKGYISELSHIGCIVGPNEGSTLEYDLERLHVRADKAGNITGFDLG